jgi:hypothetical protein
MEPVWKRGAPHLLAIAELQPVQPEIGRDLDFWESVPTGETLGTRMLHLEVRKEGVMVKVHKFLAFSPKFGRFLKRRFFIFCMLL